MRREVLTWNDVEQLIDHLIPQFEVEFDAMVMITHGGIIPGGLLAEALKMSIILTASVDFPAELEYENLKEKEKDKSRLLAWPKFLQFPEDHLLRNRRILVVDDVWGSGRTITAVKNRITGAGGIPYTCVLHFNPYRSLFGTARPDYYAATTDAYIVYPWEISRGTQGLILGGL
ncbi:phosphoribosyltransferase family protein [uncultured Thermanaerothrix sp.]|uniref:phosphoribosyltransferase n=1 Tax=uncultured Thermanaerothrix sp. TaxID=1195149 RepID=UPI0026137CC3|nr:phosphoribosyltransferase family protein [uncultured Thermanaerothrix sp.]